MMNAPGIGERLLALELAVAALQAELKALATSVASGAGKPAPDPSGKGGSSRKGSYAKE